MLSTLQRAQEFLQEWLETDTWKTADLRNWLVDKGFPVPDSDEPFIWLIRGLPEGDCYGQRERFARRVAALLLEMPDISSGNLRPRLLYNLLSLCSNMADQREILGPPLFRMYLRQRHSRTLAGDYQDVPLSDRLRAALTLNQVDRELRHEWMAMLDGRPNGYFPGNHFDGLQGLLWMPVSRNKEQWGEPSLIELGIGLAKLAHHIDKEPDKLLLFRSEIQSFEQVYPGREWGYDLLIQADRNAWPDWAADCLPCRWIERDDSVIAWMGMAGRCFVDNFPEYVKAHYVGYRFVQIMKEYSGLRRLSLTVADIENAIEERPWMSANEQMAQDRHLFQECELAARAAHCSAAVAFAQARESLCNFFTAKSR